MGEIKKGYSSFSSSLVVLLVKSGFVANEEVPPNGGYSCLPEASLSPM